MKIQMIISSLLMSAMVAHAEGTPKLGYVDMQTAIQTVKDGKDAKKKLEGEMTKKKADLEKKKGEIEKMGQEFEKKAAVLADDVRAKKESELGMEMRKYQELVAKTQMELQKQERDLMVPIVNKLRDVIKDIATKDGYTMVFEKSEQTVLFAQKDTDLTDRVITEYGKKK